MGDYIDRRKLLDTVIDYGVDLSTSELFDFILSAPSERVVSVRRGKWTPLWGGKGMQCERCKKAVINHFDSISRFEKEYWFCPNCGAKMKG